MMLQQICERPHVWKNVHNECKLTNNQAHAPCFVLMLLLYRVKTHIFGGHLHLDSFQGDTLAVGTFSGAVLVYDIPSSVALAQFDGSS